MTRNLHDTLYPLTVSLQLPAIPTTPPAETTPPRDTLTTKMERPEGARRPPYRSLLTAELYPGSRPEAGEVEQALRLAALGDAAVAEGRHEEALPLFSRALLRDPFDGSLYAKRSACLCALDAFLPSLDDANAAVALAPSNVQGYAGFKVKMAASGSPDGSGHAGERPF